MQRIFITGTDTDVGKTQLSCALLHLVNQLGYSTLAMKPIAAGCELIDGTYKNSDALALQSMQSVQLPYTQINPFAMAPAIAPHIAAQQQGVCLDKGAVTQSISTLEQSALNQAVDVFLVEGAGGWLVPINAEATLADCIAALNYSVILVVDMRLGCLNHALLTQQAIEAMGLNMLAWIANNAQPARMQAYRENLATLKHRLNAPCIGEIPYIQEPHAAELSRYLDLRWFQSTWLDGA